ncbi:MAG TPA: uracil-DNA glycosylase [Lentisphaeria bacterium]|nr:MAG: uracil-DNA glycosylase [Lentisphaerae bacterium GWF2_49_21]HBC86376.1 uracil-DNA glycosylase [Lentisphaeria bacterium]
MAANPSKEVNIVKADTENVPQDKLDVCRMPYEELEKKAAVCTRCRLHKSRTNPVFADGSRKAELMFIGEGPGRDEDAQGIPFVGRAGQLLTKMIEAMQFDRKEVYIANIVKCRPPENRAPMDDEAEQCLPYLLRQIELVQPKIIVLLGAVPLKYILGLAGITKIRGNWKEFKGIKVMPTLHPAYLLRNEAAKKDAWKDLQMVMSVFGKKYRKNS